MDQETQLDCIFQSWETRFTEHLKQLDQVARLMFQEMDQYQIPQKVAEAYVHDKISKLSGSIVEAGDRQEKEKALLHSYQQQLQSGKAIRSGKKTPKQQA